MSRVVFVFFFFLLTAQSCSTNAPRPPQIKTFVALPVENRACRDTEEGEECVFFSEIDGYIVISPEDATDLTEYIIELHDKCKNWRKK